MVFATFLVSALLGAGQPQTPPPAQQTPPAGAEQDASQATDLGTIVVEGSLESRVDRFVSEVAAAPPGARLARWDDQICVGVVNLNNRYAQFMIDRVAQHAVDVGLDIGEPGCKPNVMIVATNDASGMATRLVDNNPDGFRPALSSTDLGSAALERFKTTEAPVRWWHVSLPVSVDTGEVAVQLKGEDGPPTVHVRDVSRLRSNIREDLARIIIILDVTKVGEISFGALSDYVAMIALAQIDPSAQTSDYQSILNLFSERSPEAAMTDWDKTYLTSLYATRRDRARASQQAREIGDAMTRAQRTESDMPTPNGD
ncbi:MAG: hypothetical protein EON90_12705 [Brevundimonas sp.]|nr:MAG: hypothetical protein EON90_12705 [Brevundimonas sp.]